jgi:hypothetical protein
MIQELEGAWLKEKPALGKTSLIVISAILNHDHLSI